MSAAKEIHRLIKKIGPLTDGQASIEGLDWEDGNIQNFIFVLRPNSGYYKGGRFEFKVHLDDQFLGNRAPTVICLTDIFHPNIVTCDEDADNGNSNICFNLLENGTWNPAFGLETIAIGLLYLLNNPNIDSCLNDQLFDDYEVENFEADVRKYMRGEEVDGNYFDVQFYSNVTENNVLLETMPQNKSCDTSRVTSCDIDAMNMMCEEQTNQDDSNLGQSLNRWESCSSQELQDSNPGMKLVRVGSDTVLLNDRIGSRDVQDQSLCDMETDAMEVETGSDLKDNDNASLKEPVSCFSCHGSLVKHASLFFTRSNPVSNTNNGQSNAHTNMFKLTRTFTA